MAVKAKRWRASLLLGGFLPLCWLGMQAVHEAGHVSGAFVTGGKVTHVVLHPLAISRTDVAPNPQPLFEVWAGPILGVLVPLLGWTIVRRIKLSWEFLPRFFAGFCLVANGAYLGCGSFNAIGDAGELLRHGSPIWVLWFFGAATIPLGLHLWNGEGARFGLGAEPLPISSRTIWGCYCLLILVLGAEFLWSPAS